jgi:hypothetical protein
MVPLVTSAAWDPDERDWRLRYELGSTAGQGLAARALEHLHDGGEMSRLRSAVAEDAVITHDGQTLFAYAAGREAIERARSAIEAVLADLGTVQSGQLSHWDETLDAWVDPDDRSPAGEERRRAASSPASRTLVARVGREIRTEFEQSMRNWATELGIDCEIIEQHPHLLGEQVAFTISGPAGKLDQFAAGLKAEERATIRTEQAIMTSPL